MQADHALWQRRHISSSPHSNSPLRSNGKPGFEQPAGWGEPVALDDEPMKELYDAIPVGTAVLIEP